MIPEVVKGIDDEWLAASTVSLLKDSEDPRLHRALIEFLEHDGGYWNEPPAMIARNALHTATGHWFPFNVEEATIDDLHAAIQAGSN